MPTDLTALNDACEIISSSIVENRCILFLGPRFALDNNGQKIHKEFRQYLVNKKRMLDDEFDNLFILKDPVPPALELNRMRIDFSGYYANVVPHDIYKKIASIKFKAVISCTHDLFLKNAFSEHWKRDAAFKYFSSKGSFETKGATEHATNGLPLFYNVFGSIDDKPSLIITYDTFYEFLLKLIGDNPKIPQDLQTALSQASVLIFFGFDLDKWYIPLLFRKLKEYATTDSNDKLLAFASLDDSGKDNGKLPINGTNYDDKYFVKHFAIDILNIGTDDPIQFFDKLYTNYAVRLNLPAVKFEKKNLSEVTPEESKSIGIQLKEVKDVTAEAEIADAIERLKTIFQKFEDEYNQALLFKGQYNDINKDFYRNQDEKSRSTARANLRAAIIDYCDEKLNQVDTAKPATV